MLSFGSAVGNLFNRFGKIGLLVKQCGVYQAAQLTNFTDTVNGVVAQYNAESDLQSLIGGGYIGQLNSPGASIGGFASNLAQLTFNRMIFRDTPQIGQSLTGQNVLASVNEVIRQMNLAGATVLAMPVAASPGTFTGVGNGVMNASVKRASDGRVREMSFQENVLFTCAGDSYSGSATAGNEPFTVTGVGSANPFDFNWPLGSNGSTTVYAINPNANGSQGNVLYNSGFSSWTSNTPTYFTIQTGAAGVQIFQETSVVFGTGSAMRILGDGTTNTRFVQEFDASGTGTPISLNTLDQYSIAMFLRRDGVAPAAGVMTVDLVDGSGTVIQDAAGVANSFTIDLTLLTTNYAAYTGIFRTPAVLPAAQYLRFTLSTPLTTGRSVYLDAIGMGLTQQLYPSGPEFAVHSGSIPFEIGDYGYTAITNTRGAAGTLNTFQTLFQRTFYNLAMTNELLLPSSSSPSISDALIS